MVALSLQDQKLWNGPLKYHTKVAMSGMQRYHWLPWAKWSPSAPISAKSLHPMGGSHRQGSLLCREALYIGVIPWYTHRKPVFGVASFSTAIKRMIDCCYFLIALSMEWKVPFSEPCTRSDGMWRQSVSIHLLSFSSRAGINGIILSFCEILTFRINGLIWTWAWKWSDQARQPPSGFVILKHRTIHQGCSYSS